MTTTNLGSSVGSQATFVNADTAGELIRANSVSPPDFDSGPTGETRHRMSSEQNGMAAMIAESGESWQPLADTLVPMTPGLLTALTRGDLQNMTTHCNDNNTKKWSSSVMYTSMLIGLKTSSVVLVVIGSMPMPICNHFHEKWPTIVK